MQLSDKQIVRFQRLYQSKFGQELTREQAYEIGVKLVRIMQVVYKPLTSEQYLKSEKRKNELGF